MCPSIGFLSHEKKSHKSKKSTRTQKEKNRLKDINASVCEQCNAWLRPLNFFLISCGWKRQCSSITPASPPPCLASNHCFPQEEVEVEFWLHLGSATNTDVCGKGTGLIAELLFFDVDKLCCCVTPLAVLFMLY